MEFILKILFDSVHIYMNEGVPIPLTSQHLAIIFLNYICDIMVLVCNIAPCIYIEQDLQVQGNP